LEVTAVGDHAEVPIFLDTRCHEVVDFQKVILIFHKSSHWIGIGQQREIHGNVSIGILYYFARNGWTAATGTNDETFAIHAKLEHFSHFGLIGRHHDPHFDG
jgi:hypothetical protein